MDLGSLNMKQLKTLQRSVEKEIERRNSADQKMAIEEIRALAKARGFKLEDLLAQKPPGKRAAKPAADVQPKSKTKRGPAKIKFRHPENTTLTWTGRGRQPKWVVEWLGTGKTMEGLTA
jgi:DNA-binding protein H-NS